MTTTMATARWVMARRATTTTVIATGKDNDSNDGDGVTGDGAMGYNDDNDDNDNNKDGNGATCDEAGRDGRRQQR